MSDVKLDIDRLIFPSASRSITQFLTDSRRSALTISARLRSIDQDAQFVQKVQAAYNLPLIANERCGSWYIDPVSKAQSAYFKSTDGHSGQWSLSLRRLNLQVLEAISHGDGCIIVDSTRRGKSMPDALSKSVPIWIAVWNRMLFPDDPNACQLKTPEDVVPPSEHSQIEVRLDQFLAQLTALQIDLDSIRARCKKPMLPVWVTHTTGLTPALDNPDYYPVVLCTASRHLPSDVAAETGYVQGAADDHESWALGLTPLLYWADKTQLLSTPEDDLPDLIAGLVKRTPVPQVPSSAVLIRPTTNLFLGSNTAVLGVESQRALHIRLNEKSPPDDVQDGPCRRLELTCPPGKIGSRALRHELTKVTPFLEHHGTASARVLVTCTTGIDHSIGVALAVLCLYLADSKLVFEPSREKPRLGKDIIKQRLGVIMQSIPSANPSRATLQSVNAFLLS